METALNPNPNSNGRKENIDQGLKTMSIWTIKAHITMRCIKRVLKVYQLIWATSGVK